MSKKDINKDKKKSNFFKELKAELKKVTWPTLKKLVNNTTAVITIVLILSAIVFVLDVIFESMNDFGVEKLKALVSTNTEETEVVEDGEGLNENIETEVVENNETESTETAENSEESTNTEVNAETEIAE